jgi:hypothetical protein
MCRVRLATSAAWKDGSMTDGETVQPAGRSESDRHLDVYLNDHLAGSAVGLRLIRRSRDRFTDSSFASVLARLADEFEEDRHSLEQVMSAVGATKNPVKEAVAAGAEIMMRVKNAAPVVGAGSDAVADFENIEVLELGVECKRLLWRALQRVAHGDERLRSIDLDSLERRADHQREALEGIRLELAGKALSSDLPSPPA